LIQVDYHVWYLFINGRDKLRKNCNNFSSSISILLSYRLRNNCTSNNFTIGTAYASSLDLCSDATTIIRFRTCHRRSTNT